MAVVKSSEVPAGYSTGFHMFGTAAAENLNNTLYVWNISAPKIDDIKLSKYRLIPNGVKVTLDLNGKTLDRGLTDCEEFGSVIFVEPDAELTVKDSSGNNSGVITGGASWNGGGIRNHGVLTFEGGTIKGNKAQHLPAGLGGGIYSSTYYNNNVTLTITGGVIENNEAHYGAGVYIGDRSTNVKITGCSILSNTAKRGGVVYAAQNNTIYFDATEIKENTADTGSALYLNYGCKATMKNVLLDTNHINTLNEAEYELYEGAVFKEPGSEFYEENVSFQDATVYTSWKQLRYAIMNSNITTFTLTQDLTAESTDECILITAGRKVVLDLNGKTLDRGLTECKDHGGGIRIEPDAELTIIDSSGYNSGVITGGASWNGGGICNHGTLTFEGGTIKGNKALHDEHGGGGGGVYVEDSARLDLKDCTLQKTPAVPTVLRSSWGAPAIQA